MEVVAYATDVLDVFDLHSYVVRVEPDSSRQSRADYHPGGDESRSLHTRIVGKQSLACECMESSGWS